MTVTVYRVTCISTEESYIGSTSQAINRRFNEHRSRLATGIHENQGLQAAWDLHGADAFEYVALLVVPEEDRAQAEQDCIHATPGALNVTSPIARSEAQRRADRVDARVAALLAGRGWPKVGELT